MRDKAVATTVVVATSLSRTATAGCQHLTACQALPTRANLPEAAGAGEGGVAARGGSHVVAAARREPRARGGRRRGRPRALHRARLVLVGWG